MSDHPKNSVGLLVLGRKVAALILHIGHPFVVRIVADHVTVAAEAHEHIIFIGEVGPLRTRDFCIVLRRRSDRVVLFKGEFLKCSSQLETGFFGNEACAPVVGVGLRICFSKAVQAAVPVVEIRI